jgi:hypothetical protein
MTTVSTAAEETALTPDERVAEAICRDLRYAGKAFHHGEYVAILDGEVIMAGDSFEAVERVLDERAPDPGRGLIVLVQASEPDVIRLPIEGTSRAPAFPLHRGLLDACECGVAFSLDLW